MKGWKEKRREGKRREEKCGGEGRANERKIEVIGEREREREKKKKEEKERE